MNEKIKDLIGQVVHVRFRKDSLGNQYHVYGLLKGKDQNFIFLYETTNYVEQADLWGRYGDTWYNLSDVMNIHVLDQNDDIPKLVLEHIEKYRKSGDKRQC